MKKTKYTYTITEANCPHCHGTGLSEEKRCQAYMSTRPDQQCNKEALQSFIEETPNGEHELWFCGYHYNSFKHHYSHLMEKAS